MQTPEHKRVEVPLQDQYNPWKTWGPYVSERAWGTVREDYSPEGDAWNYLTHDMARSKAYRWGEDGIAGFCDAFQMLVFSLGFWNGQDPILKERLFGLNPFEGNHGEDVKEYYFYLDATPTYSYAKYLYKYPQKEYPYAELIAENQKRSALDREYELLDTKIFQDNRYFDIVVEYAKESPSDICIRVEAFNRGDKPAILQMLPQLWFRNRWSFDPEFSKERPVITKKTETEDSLVVLADGSMMPSPEKLFQPYQLEPFYLYGDKGATLLFTDNESNDEKLFGSGAKNKSPYVKDAFHRHIIEGENCINPENRGTKVCFQYKDIEIAPGKSHVIHLRLTSKKLSHPLADIDRIMNLRKEEADLFYDSIQSKALTEDEKKIQRQALAGMLWSKQFYFYDVKQWFQGDDPSAAPSTSRFNIRNYHWTHLSSSHLFSMPDKWEYPWFAAWDLAFHCLPLALVDLDFAKEQLKVLLTHHFQHPNGQIPAYEWGFSDLNPPVQAWVLWELYTKEVEQKGKGDRHFLELCFAKLVTNFVWWINKVDRQGNNFFEGGFLGLDNISVIDRSKSLSGGGHIEQADGTGWMGFFSLMMMKIALELAKEDPIFQDVATTYFEHFSDIAAAIQGGKGLFIQKGIDMWDEEDGFFYDVIAYPNATRQMLKIRSFVGLIPFFSLEFFETEELEKFPRFYKHFLMFNKLHPKKIKQAVTRYTYEGKERYLLSMMNLDQIKRLLKCAWDPAEFLSVHGLRSLSKYHQEHPFSYDNNQVGYEPAESIERIKGGNSNWRGPIWLPMNILFLNALERLKSAVGGHFQIQDITLDEMILSLKNRLIDLFRKDAEGNRAIFHNQNFPENDPHWKDLILFYEHYHGDTGRGLGASHQTGWSGVIASVIDGLK